MQTGWEAWRWKAAIAVWGGLCAFTIAHHAHFCLARIVGSGNRNAFSGRLGIDTATYVQRAREMIVNCRYLVVKDTGHSVGMQIYTAAWFRAFPNPATQIFALKVGNFLAWAGCLLLFYLISAQLFESAAVALGLTALMSASNQFSSFCALVQYEIPVSFLLSLALWAILRKRMAPAGLLVALASVFRAHFAVIFLACAGWLILRRERRSAIAFTAGFFTVALPWNLFYSLTFNEFFFFNHQLFNHSEIAVNPNAPSGELNDWKFPLIQFTLRPDLYLTYLGNKLAHLFGIVPHLWHVETTLPLLGDTIVNVLSAILFALGILFGRGVRYAALFTTCVFIPVLLTPAYSRYTVPILPFMALVEAAAAVGIWRQLRRHWA